MTMTEDAWKRGNPYDRYIGRWSRSIARLFLSWLRMPPDLKWLDVGCGTGALCAEILDRCRPLTVTGVEPSEGFLATAKEALSNRAILVSGNAAAIPLDDSSVDAVVSALVLNFVPDQRAALAEMSRVTRHGGTIAAYVWDYAGSMQIIRQFWEAAVELDGNAVALDERARFADCNPDSLREAFTGAGLMNVDVTALDMTARFASFEDYWEPFLGGQGPAPAYAMALTASARSELRSALKTRLPTRADGSLELAARAWAVRGDRV